MKTIKNLSVTVTYKVGLGNIKMPENIYAEIIEAIENCDSIKGVGEKYQNASEWLSSNIRERDCFDWETNVDNIL